MSGWETNQSCDQQYIATDDSCSCLAYADLLNNITDECYSSSTAATTLRTSLTCVAGVGDSYVLADATGTLVGCNTSGLSSINGLVTHNDRSTSLVAPSSVECGSAGEFQTGLDTGNTTLGFVGPYASDTWAVVLSGVNDSVWFGADGTTLVIQGSDSRISPGRDLNITTRVSKHAVLNGTFRFSWTYESVDTNGAFFDPAFYLNNQAIQLSADFGPLTQNGSISMYVENDDLVGFAVSSTDLVQGWAVGNYRL